MVYVIIIMACFVSLYLWLSLSKKEPDFEEPKYEAENAFKPDSKKEKVSFKLNGSTRHGYRVLNSSGTYFYYDEFGYFIDDAIDTIMFLELIDSFDEPSYYPDLNHQEQYTEEQYLTEQDALGSSIEQSHFSVDTPVSESSYESSYYSGDSFDSGSDD